MMSKRYIGQFNLSLLHEELQGIPGYITIEKTELGDNTKIAHYQLIEEKDGVTVSVELHLSYPDVVIAAHDYTQKSVWELEQEAKAIKKQTLKTKLNLSDDEIETLKDLLK